MYTFKPIYIYRIRIRRSCTWCSQVQRVQRPTMEIWHMKVYISCRLLC